MAESSGSKREAFIGVGGQPQDYGAHGRPAKLAASPARAAGKAGFTCNFFGKKSINSQ
jgi:hypothetical protein